MNLICLSFHHIKTGYTTFQKVKFESPEEFYENGKGERLLLQTGTRVEAYAYADSAELFLDMFTLKSGLQKEEIEEFFNVYSGGNAIMHLFRMVGSIESRVLGETYIPLAVKSSLELAKKSGAAGPKMMALFDAAVRVGKRARAETKIEGNVPVVEIVMESILSGESTIDGKRALLLGAGGTGIKVSRALASRGFEITAICRNRETGEIAARAAGGRAAEYSQLKEATANSDVLVCATLASHYRVLHEMIAKRKSPLVIVDVSPFRNVSPDVAGIPGVILKNGEIERAVAGNHESAKAEVPKVERIIEEEISKVHEELA